ncbi:LAFA_0D08306g1_1 [Lachancea sp. 'fantastica']|nr:LAFA_0D08306g1_1 [Lachancea sp. 'fantastica']
MAGKSSPFKSFTHHRGNSTDGTPHSQGQHRKTPSIGQQNPPIAGHTRNASRTSNASVSSNFLAEQYERDRKAILSSCFSEDPTGPGNSSRLSKTYVTHVRIIEDTRYPSSRPPVSSPLANKKKRVLIVSALTNGAGMQIHKARENSNGSFQIGRTWPLKELVCVERDVEQPEGFLLTMGKRYYWETNTAKERTVFVKTLIRIYMEDSGGRVPQLLNWDLALFYMDRNSYQRALISSSEQKDLPGSTASPSRPPTTGSKQSSGMSGSDAPPHIPPAPVKLPALPQQPKQPRSQQQHATFTPLATKKGENLPYEVSKPSAASVPQAREPPEIKTASPIRTASPPLNRSSPSLKSLNDTASKQVSHSSKDALSQQNLSHVEPLDLSTSQVSQNADEGLNAKYTIHQPLEHRRSQTPESSSFLSELNSVLREPSNPPDLKAHALSDEQDSHHTQGRSGIEESKRAEFEVSKKYASSNEGHSLEVDENTNELSFEKGDEVRYSQILEEEKDTFGVPFDTQGFEDEKSDDGRHAYHEVSVIREEPTDSAIGGANTEGTNTVPNALSQVENELLMETLEDVNWSIEDDSVELLSKLSNKLAGTEYLLNKELVALPKTSSAFPTFRQKVLAECEKVDPTLSFFAMELSTVSRDIEYVESQANGLQVESANKKMLWKELSDVLSSVSVDEVTLNNILARPLSERNLQQIENLLQPLYTALKAIRGDFEEEDGNLGMMKALIERRQAYEAVTERFIMRVADEIHAKFVNMQHEKVPIDQLPNVLSRLLMFSSVILFAKDIACEVYTSMIDDAIHETQVLLDKKSAPLLQYLESRLKLEGNKDAVSSLSDQKDLLNRWKTGHAVKQFEPLKPKNAETLYEMISALKTMESLALTYQNFVGAFFHLNDGVDFEEYVATYPELTSRSLPLEDIQPLESDRESAQLKTQLMTRIFQSIFNDFFGEILGFLKDQAPLIPLVMIYLEGSISRYSESNQEFLATTFEKFYARFTQEWEGYIDDQSTAIERVSINANAKRVAPFAVGLPAFVARIEDEVFFTAEELQISNEEYPRSRQIFDKSYNSLGQALLSVLQKGSHIPSSDNMMPPSTTSDESSKSIWLLINCNWIIEVLPNFGHESLFVDCLQTTRRIFNVERDKYAETLLRNSMNHLYSFVDGAYSLMEISKNRVVTSSQWTVYSQQNLNKILERYSSTEITAVVARLYETIQRDIFHEGQNEVSTILLDRLWSCTQGQTVSLYLKLYTLIEKHYKGSSAKFTKNDIISAFNSHKTAA